MLKKALLRLGVCAAVLAALVWYFFFDMGRLPKGTLVASCPSPALTHTVNIYECAGTRRPRIPFAPRLSRAALQGISIGNTKRISRNANGCPRTRFASTERA